MRGFSRTVTARHLPELPYIEEVRDGTFTMLE